MFNFLELEKDDVKKLIKIVGEKDFKKAPKNILPDKRVVLRALKKDLSRLEFSKLRSYVEEHLDDIDDEIVGFYCKLLGKKMAEEYPYMGELQNIVGESQYEKLAENQKINIEEYRGVYEANPIPVDFDIFIKFLCMPSEETIEKIVENKNEEIINNLKDEVEKIKADYNRLVTDYNNQVKKAKVLNNEVIRLRKVNESLEKSMSFENKSFNLKDLLPAGFQAISLTEIYNELTRIEQDTFYMNNFEICSKVLAAKFTIVKLMKEGKK